MNITKISHSNRKFKTSSHRFLQEESIQTTLTVSVAFQAFELTESYQNVTRGGISPQQKATLTVLLEKASPVLLQSHGRGTHAW